MKMKIGSILLGTMIVTSALTAFAGSTHEGYSIQVPRLNGSAYTNTQTKVTQGAAAGLKSTNTGGYNVDVRMRDSNNNSGDWARNIRNIDSRAIDGAAEHKAGDKVRLQFSSDITTTVNTSAQGTWRSN